ncbi:MAG: DUF4440 domain-containing protein [Gammaproteobacteria bacterium]|nr:MAG: DUF4440 domain-containing protein [Gammaproteobacteria bacterium]
MILTMGFSSAQVSDVANPVSAGDKQTSTEAESPAHKALRDLRTVMQTALNQRDLDTLLQHVTDDVVFTTMNGDRVVGKAGIRQYFTKMLEGTEPVVKSIKAQFTVESLSHLYGDNVAVAFGHSNDNYQLSNGDTWTVTPQWSTTVVRQNGQWLIADFHYSVNMFDNPILTTQRTWLLGGGLIAALLALIVGFFLGRKFR